MKNTLFTVTTYRNSQNPGQFPIIPGNGTLKQFPPLYIIGRFHLVNGFTKCPFSLIGQLGRLSQPIHQVFGKGVPQDVRRDLHSRLFPQTFDHPLHATGLQPSTPLSNQQIRRGCLRPLRKPIGQGMPAGLVQWDLPPLAALALAHLQAALPCVH